MRLASHLHMSLQRVRAETTSTEFLLWADYLVNEDTQHTREHYYLAQISADIRRQYSGKRKVTTGDSMLTFVGPKEAMKTRDLEEQQQKSKNAWVAILGPKKKR